MRKLLLLVTVLGARVAAAQDDEGARLFPLLSIGAARSFPVTLGERGVTATLPATGGAPTTLYRESVRLRLDGQWGIIAEGRLPVGARQVWGIEAYGARFSGRARASAARQLASAAAPGIVADSVDYRIGGVTSWRGTLGVARAVALPGRLTGALLLGGTWGVVRSANDDCLEPAPPPSGAFPSGAAVCAPVVDRSTPGATVGADVFTRPWRRMRFRVSAKGDVLRIDEAEVRRSLRWSALSTAPAGAGRPRWHTLPSLTAGVELQLR